MHDMHVRAMGVKQFRVEPLTDKEKARLRAANGVKSRWSKDDRAINTKPSDDPKFVAPYSIKKISKRRKFSGCRLSDETRALVEQRKLLKAGFLDALRGGK